MVRFITGAGTKNVIRKQKNMVRVTKGQGRYELLHPLLAHHLVAAFDALNEHREEGLRSEWNQKQILSVSTL